VETTDNILEVRNLRTYFFTEDGVVHAVDGVDLTVKRGETLGVVGESGCGKSVTFMSVMRLIGMPGRIVEGEIRFNGQSLFDLPESEMVQIRGNKISMIFQQPISSLNPVFKVGDQVAEVFEIHQGLNHEQARARAIDMLGQVGIPDPERRAEAYPHEMSGGMAQRVMIAMGLATSPELLIADEPTTALDVTIQAQILDLMRALKERLGMSIVFITHDLGVVAEMADNVAVMYAGQVVEYTNVDRLFSDPKMPYTQGLLASVPVLGEVKDELESIPGTVPNLVNPPNACRFAPRCRARVEHGLTICERVEPQLLPVDRGRHTVRCWLYHDYKPEGYKAPYSTGIAAEPRERRTVELASARQ
jgi:peptide/nickel transport system ATP-binding protein